MKEISVRRFMNVNEEYKCDEISIENGRRKL